jgi:hypothetical protein
VFGTYPAQSKGPPDAILDRIAARRGAGAVARWRKGDE